MTPPHEVFAIDGPIVYPGVWSFMFCIALVALVWFCGLAAMVGSSLIRRNTLAIYNRSVLAIVLVVLTIIVYPSAGELRPARGHFYYRSGTRVSHFPDRPIAKRIVPKWWPLHGVRWRLTSIGR